MGEGERREGRRRGEGEEEGEEGERREEKRAGQVQRVECGVLG